MPVYRKNLDRFLHPTILRLLAQGKTHGYDLVQRLHELKMFSEIPPDPSGIYKILKSMEGMGLVASSWEVGGFGPAKRSFELTQDGVDCLQTWIETMKRYRTQLDSLLDLLDLKNELPVAIGAKSCQCRDQRCV
jgi:DNA-binding PadR family transcriptional regulator